MPGFTSEASLYKSAKSYTAAPTRVMSGGVVVPALRKNCVAAESTIEANTWCHLCAVYDDVTMCAPIFDVCRTVEVLVGFEGGCQKGGIFW